MNGTDQTVVYRTTSGVYHIPNSDGLPACNTHNEATNPNEDREWATKKVSETESRVLCSRCASMGPEGHTRREIILEIRSEIPSPDEPPINNLTSGELREIADRLGSGVVDDNP